MSDESPEVSSRSYFGAVLATILAIALAIGVFVVALHPFPKWGGSATMTMSAPQEMFYLPYPPDPVDCGSDHFEYARSLGQLPGRIRVDTGQFVDIADFGEPYDGGRGPSGLPTHRFAGAAVGHDHIFVVVEGVEISTASHDVLWTFERHGAQWIGHTEFGGGSTVAEILEGICRQPKWRRHATVGETQIDCEFNPHGMVTIQYSDSRHRGGFVARTRDPILWNIKPEDIRDLSSHNPPSPDERVQMLRVLQAVQPSMTEDVACRFWVDRYVDALNGAS